MDKKGETQGKGWGGKGISERRRWKKLISKRMEQGRRKMRGLKWKEMKEVKKDLGVFGVAKQGREEREKAGKEKGERKREAKEGGKYP